MKYVILVGDGMGDRPLPELAGRTPLEAASTPAMDRLAREGEISLLQTIPAGYPPGSDVANLSLLGYRPEECYTGRAPLEAASMGVALASDEVAFRCNLVTLEHGETGAVTMVDYSAGHIGTDEARELVLALERKLGGEGHRFYPGVSYRHLFVCRGGYPGLETVPPHDHTGRDVAAFWRRYLAFPDLAAIVEQAGRLLADHPVNAARRRQGHNPANSIWLWGEGKTPAMATLKERYGLSGALISAVDLLKGIGVCAGLEVVNVEGATGYLDTNYQGKAEAALAAAARHDLVFVHVEAPDEAGHQGSLEKKIRAIEDFDARIVRPIVDGLAGTEFRLALAMDHLTPLAIRTHAGEPVPVVIFDSRRKTGGADGYSEKAAAAAGRRLADGRAFFETLLERR
ncbi:MAG: cofactor-independent phosphoglycerate mutase [Desulfobacteraceae bacterium]|nr:cofactor-independent phosphoglycerate mutase [Desulfobacteraceae bacterium]